MKRVSAISLVTVLVLAAATTAVSSKKDGLGTIAGSLTDWRTGRPIVAAWVAVLETNQGTYTDSTGCFDLEALAPGRYNLVITHPDYGKVEGLAELMAQVTAGETSHVSISLNRSPGDEQDKDYKKSKTFLDHMADWLGVGNIVEEEARESGSIQAPGMPTAPSGGASMSEVPRHSGRSKCPPQPGYYPGPDGYSRPPRDMFFQDYGVNGFVDTRHDRFSTFALDVDDASYNLARRYLLDGSIPPPDAIRVEEFINHFDYGYNVPDGEKFRVFAEITGSPFDSGRHFMKVGVKGREIDRHNRQPLNLTLVIDVSGSMGRGNRFSLVLESVRALVRQLNEHDRVGVVAYGSDANVVLEPIAANQHWDIFEAVDRLRPGGSTFAEAGIRLGYEMANRQFVSGHGNLVILCSDGVANVGRTRPDEIMREVEHFARRGISLNTYGYGMGNYNDVLLEQLAQKGDGRYAYINDHDEVRRIFVGGFVGNMQLLARDVKVQVEFNPDLVGSYRLLGYENRDVPDHRFRDRRQDGGEIGAGHEVTALYELIMPTRREGGEVGTVFVRWKNPDETEIAELSREVKLPEHHQPFDRSRPELRLAMTAGRFAEMLKGTTYASETSYEDLYRLAEPLARQIPGKQTEDLLELIRCAGSLAPWHTDYPDGDGVFGNYKR